MSVTNKEANQQTRVITVAYFLAEVTKVSSEINLVNDDHLCLNDVLQPLLLES